jgi:cell division protein FtsQ
MDPRLRRRRVEVARSAGRRRRTVLLVVLSVLTLVVLAWFGLHTRWFSARVVRVSGNTHTPAAAVVAAAGLARQPPLVSVDPGAAAAAVERLPWVDHAVVQRHWPDAVSVAVTERTPVAATPAPGGWALVDATGRVLARSAAPPPGLPHLSAVPAAGVPGTRLAAVAAPVVQVAATLPPAFRGQVTGVVLQPGGQVGLTLTTPVTIDLGTTADLATKYEDAAALLAGAALHPGDAIDVSVPDAPVVTGP